MKKEKTLNTQHSVFNAQVVNEPRSIIYKDDRGRRWRIDERTLLPATTYQLSCYPALLLPCLILAWKFIVPSFIGTRQGPLKTQGFMHESPITDK